MSSSAVPSFADLPIDLLMRIVSELPLADQMHLTQVSKRIGQLLSSIHVPVIDVDDLILSIRVSLPLPLSCSLHRLGRLRMSPTTSASLNSLPCCALSAAGPSTTKEDEKCSRVIQIEMRRGSRVKRIEADRLDTPSLPLLQQAMRTISIRRRLTFECAAVTDELIETLLRAPGALSSVSCVVFSLCRLRLLSPSSLRRLLSATSVERLFFQFCELAENTISDETLSGAPHLREFVVQGRGGVVRAPLLTDLTLIRWATRRDRGLSTEKLKNTEEKKPPLLFSLSEIAASFTIRGLLAAYQEFKSRAQPVHLLLGVLAPPTTPEGIGENDHVDDVIGQDLKKTCTRKRPAAMPLTDTVSISEGSSLIKFETRNLLPELIGQLKGGGGGEVSRIMMS